MAISKFWGFPIGLMTLPVVTPKAKDKRRSFGEMPWDLAMYKTRGVPIIARVSFIRKAERMPVPNRISSTRWSRLLALPKRR